MDTDPGPPESPIKALIFTLILFAGTILGGSLHAETETVRVRHVIDGDTVVLEDGRHVRLLGIDAPEYQPWKGVAEPLGLEARDTLKRLVEGHTVRLEMDREREDRYGRLLAHIQRSGELSANIQMIRLGLAHARYYPPNDSHRAEHEQAQSEAAQEQMGLWA